MEVIEEVIWGRSMLLLLTAYLIFCSSTIVSVASSCSYEEEIPWERESAYGQQSSTCGVYAAVAALSACGRYQDATRFLNSEYVSQGGTTVTQLQKLLADCDVESVAMKNLTLPSLEFSENPIILLLKDRMRRESPGHWVTFLGTNPDGSLEVFDPARLTKPARISKAELLSQWDGVGIIVDSKRSSFSIVFVAADSLLKLGFCAAAGFWFSRTLEKMAKIPIAVSVMISSALTALGLIIFDSGSIFNVNNQKFMAWQRSQFLSTESLKELSFAEFDLLRTNGAVLIDSRMRHDFERVHLAKTINIPPDSRLSDFDAITNKIGKETPVVVFCARLECGYAEMVARRLKSQGFENTAIFRPGIVVLLERQIMSIEKTD